MIGIVKIVSIKILQEGINVTDAILRKLALVN